VATLNQPKAAPASRYDAVVEAQLARARGRLRALDLTVGFLGLVGGTLAYALGMVLLDRWLQLPPLARQGALLVYLLAALVYVALGIVRPLCRRINPYYAARHIEQSVPGAKNSVVNWLDLHARPLPPAIHSALSQRAARDLARVDLERAISGRRAGWLGLFTGLLVVALFIALLVFGPAPFYSLLGRNFAPFVEAPIATRTVLTLKAPEGGNTTVGVGRPVRFAVEVEGRVPDAGAPDALHLLYHYQPGDPYEEQALERENGAEWATTLAPFKVQNGFWYKVRGGDAETAEYQVQVRATPLVNEFEAAYHYRPYLGWRDDVIRGRDGNLRAMRGTEVTLTAHTNRAVRVPDGRLELEFGPERQTVPAQAVPDDPHALRFKLVLEKDGMYRVRFLSTDGEENSDTRTYTIQALPDHEPRVELRKPGQDVTLPANGLLPLEGVATDDIGLRVMTLCLRLAKGDKLQDKPYRAGKSFQLKDGSYPRSLEYRDFVDLASLKDEAGRPVKLEPKAVVEYWLEATDNCDYPAPNVGKSKTYKVTIGEPDPDQKKQQQDRQKAQKEKKEHDANQDKQLNKENQAGRGDRNPEHAQQDGDKKQEQKPDQPGKQESKPGEEQRQPDQKDQGEKQKQPNEQSGGQGDNKQEKQDQGPDNRQQKQDQGQDNKQQGKSDQGQHEKKPGNAGKGQNQQAGQENKQDQQSGSNGQGADDQRRKEAEKLAQALKDQNAAGGKENSPKNEAGKEPKGDGQAKLKSQPGREAENKSNSQQSSKPGGEQKPGTSPEKNGDHTGKQPDAKSPKPDNPKELNREPGTPQGSRPKQEGDPQTLSRNDNPQPGPKNGNEQRPGGGDNPSGKKNGEQPETKEGAGSDKVPPQEAKKEDVERLAKKGRDGKPEERQQASQKLEAMSREAKDPEAREAARKALEEQARNQQDQPKPGDKKGEPQASQPKEGQPKESQPKNAEGNKAGDKGNNKSGEKNAKAGDRKPGGEAGTGAGEKGSAQGAGDQAAGGQPGGQPPQGGAGTPGGAGTQSGQGGTPGGGAKPAGTDAGGTAKGSGGEPGEQPGGGGGNGKISTRIGNSPEEPTPPPDGQPAAKSHRPGDLVLEDLRKTIEELKKHPEEMKKVLNRAGMTEKNLHDVEDYLQEKLPPPQQTGKLSDLGARRVATGTAKSPDAQAAGTALPPPGFRDSTREFSRRLAEPEK
jgi:hypothetical protein